MNRRVFLAAATAAPFFLGAAKIDRKATTMLDSIISRLKNRDAKIDAVEFFGISVDAERRFSYTVQRHRQHAFIRIATDKHSGWGEANLGTQDKAKPFDKHVWRMKWYKEFIGKTVSESLQMLFDQRDQRAYRELEYAEMALLDLAGRLIGKPTVELLQLNGRDPVPGLYCILSDDPVAVKEGAKKALEQNLRTHLKVKLYGKRDVDVAVVDAARTVYGKDAYIVGDVNYGYRREASEESLDDIRDSMLALRKVGLSACEDPAALTSEQWIDLQKQVGQLDLVPDVPMRPSWKARETTNKEMGRVFNMHPACMGSIIETVLLGKIIKSWDRRLMVGDSSLIGTACPAWQQIAIGLNADWCEAIEKPQENKVFQQCLLTNPVSQTDDGKFALPNPLPGFGIELDLEKLKQRSYATLSL